MVCQNCSAANPDGQPFCGSCGHRLTAETIGSLTERVSKVEKDVREASRNTVNTHNMELESAANVMSRVRHWMTLFMYFAGIPLVILALTLAVIFGKDTFDIRHIAADAQSSINDVLKQAQAEAANAKRTADDASSKAQAINRDITNTEQSVSKLKTEVDARSADVQKLSAQLDASQQQLAALIARANGQEAQFAKMTQQVQAIQTAKGVADVQSVYPIYGQHVAQGPHGEYIDAKAKPPGAIYLDLNLSLTQTPNVSDTNVGSAVAALSNANFTVSVGPVYMIARTASGSAQNVGYQLGPGSCIDWVKSGPHAPCILYFKSSLKDSAAQVRNLVKVAQEVPADHVFYLDPASLTADQRELLNLSGVDFEVVLGQ